MTLIELLVVMAIISLLLGMLLPGLGSARRNARDTKCLAVIKDVGSSVALYATSHDELIPPTALTWHPTQERILKEERLSRCKLPMIYGWAELLYEHAYKSASIEDRASYPVQRNFRNRYGEFLSCPSAERASDHSGHFRVYNVAWERSTFTTDDSGMLTYRYGSDALSDGREYFSERISRLEPRLPILGDSNEYSESGDGRGSLPIPLCSREPCPTEEASWLGMTVNPRGGPVYNTADAWYPSSCAEKDSSVTNRFARRHSKGTNFLFGDLHVERSDTLGGQLACDWDINGVHDGKTDRSRRWSNWKHMP